MASSTPLCTIDKCEIYSCAVCHCCQNNLCLDHLKEHKDQLNDKLIPLANQINTLLDDLQQYTPTSSSTFNVLEEWRIAAHATIDRFCQRIQHELFEQKKKNSLEKLHKTRNTLDQLICKQGATRQSIDLLINDIQSIQQEIESAQNIQINLRPLVIDENAILQQQHRKSIEHVHPSSHCETASGSGNNVMIMDKNSFQIFVESPFQGRILVTVKPSDTIMELKRKIQDRTEIPIDQQRLTYMCKTLRVSGDDKYE